MLGTHYDSLISDYPYDALTKKLKLDLVGKGFDIGAGSGLITVELALQGLSVIAVDPSESMLDRAKERAQKARVKPTFVLGRAEDVELTPCDFVVCTCDVVNYFKSKSEFCKFVKKVYASLRPDGKFVFDLRRMEILKGMKDEIYYEDGEDLTYLWSNSIKRDKLVMDISFFTKRPDGAYDRRDEVHEMLMISDEEIEECLKSVGFSYEIYGDGLKRKRSSDKRRFFFCAKK